MSKLYCLLLLFGASALPSWGQDLQHSRQSSYHTYIYQLDHQQARQIYRKGLSVVDSTYFVHLVDQYPTDSTYRPALPFGNYLRTWTNQDSLMVEPLSVSNVDLRVLNNGTDLRLQLYDSAGAVVPNAQVQLRNKRVPWDAQQGVYRLRKNNRQGLVEIQYDQHTSFFYLERQLNNGRWRRVSKKVLFSVPLKYVTIPLGLIIRSPLDVYYSVRRKYPQGIFYYLYRPFRTLYTSIRYGEPQGWVGKVACLFDREHCSFRYNQYQGYMAFNQPIYRPGDTVRCKAYVVNHRKKPVNKPLIFRLGNGQKIKTKVQPYRPGAYTFAFVLHDSLQLTLDRQHRVQCGFEYYPGLIGSWFSYEDYELSNSVYDLEAESPESHRGEPVVLRLKGTDTNGLNLLDARADVAVLPTQVSAIEQPTCLVPDTLWAKNLSLEPAGATSVHLPDSIFPRADLAYQVAATFYTAERDQAVRRVDLMHWQQSEKLGMTLMSDTLRLEQRRGENVQSVSATLTAYDEDDHLLFARSLQLPTGVPIAPRAHRYALRTDSLSVQLLLHDESSEVRLLTQRTQDSLKVRLENPRRLPVYYHVYRKNREIYRGQGTTLDYAIETTTSAHYFVALQYVWGDRVVEEHYEIPFQEEKLNVQLYQPAVVYPGQAPELRVRVTDAEARPVPDVDITAYGLTKKFERYQPPAVPYLGKEYPSRTLINTFTKRAEVLNQETAALYLDWQRWNAQMHLDSIAYYRFLYPASGTFISCFATSDSSTQLAPYVVQQGKLLPVHIIYIDNRPVYFSMVNHQLAYAFPVDSGYHQLRVRTAHHELTVDSVYLRPGVKSLISFRLEQSLSSWTIEQKPSELTDAETRLVNRYLYGIKNTFQDRTTYLTQDQRTFLLEKNAPYWQSPPEVFITGPLSANRPARFVKDRRFATRFTPEPGYQHEFQPQLLKLRSTPPLLPLGRALAQYERPQPFGDLALTERTLEEMLAAERMNRRIHQEFYLNADHTSPGRGKIGLLSPVENQFEGKIPKNMVLLNDQQPTFSQVYPGRIRPGRNDPANQQILHDLLPGEYRLLVLMTDNRYWEMPGIQVRPHGTTYLRLAYDTLRLADSVSQRINRIIQSSFRQAAFTAKQRREDLQEVSSTYHRSQRRFAASGEDVYGTVVDEETGEPLPGVNVVVKGTTFGTTTDLAGRYYIKVPRNAHTLVFSWIGTVTQEVVLGASTVVNVRLAPDIQHLEEVIVVGYGTQEKHSLTATMSIVSADGLPTTLSGVVAGVRVDDEFPKGQKIQIASRSNLLYVIDGVPYEGPGYDLDPANVARTERLDAATATALYGARGAGGAVLITTRANQQGINQSVMSDPLGLVAQASPLRSNFSDYAFWEPTVRTNQQGIATLSPRFPDDVTGWRTFFLAMSPDQQSGQAEGFVKAYKPVMGTLAVPRFLVAGDTTHLIGKTLNYTPDSLRVTSTWEISDRVVRSDTVTVRHAAVAATQLVAPPTDSLTATYRIESEAGFTDGEQRAIPIFSPGTLATVGSFHVLERDTSFHVSFDSLRTEVTLHAEADVWSVMLDEIEHVRNYAYLCNEQAASKLMALVGEKKICSILDETFEHEKQVEKLIKQLENARQDTGLWGWWPQSAESYWISEHVLEALLVAKQAGFAVALDQSSVRDRLGFTLESSSQPDKLLRALRLLQLLEEPIEVARYVDLLQKDSTLTLAQRWEMVRLQQRAGSAAHALEELVQQKQETLFGGMYWEDTTQRVDENTLLTTLLAYQVLREEAAYRDALPNIRRYLMDQRGSGHYRNTYESARVLSTLLPDLLDQYDSLTPPTLRIGSGDSEQTIKEFPFTAQWPADQPLELRKTGASPIYFTAYQRHHDPAPAAVAHDFAVSTAIDSPGGRWRVGEEVHLRVTVRVKKYAEYVMIEVPVPGGCSYLKKDHYRPLEVHREYFREKVSIFCRALRPGEHTFTIGLLPSFSGSYHLNPARAELMYFPTFFGRNTGRRVVIEEK